MAQADFFIKIDGIDGEATDDKHKNEIDVLSWSWGGSNSGTFGEGGGSGSGKWVAADFTFNMKVSKASPMLFLANATGKHIPSALLTCRKASGDKQIEHLKIKLTPVMITAYQTGGSEGSEMIESVTLNFGRIDITYTGQDGKGGTVAPLNKWYDKELNKGG